MAFNFNLTCRCSFPLIIQKSDGGYGYDSTDMAALHHRLFTLQRDWIIYITDAGQVSAVNLREVRIQLLLEQASHFHLCFGAARAAGWITDLHRVDHIGFGVVCGDDGKRFRTRAG
jgi:arginyl-tRNA synthetase